MSNPITFCALFDKINYALATGDAKKIEIHGTMIHNLIIKGLYQFSPEGDLESIWYDVFADYVPSYYQPQKALMEIYSIIMHKIGAIKQPMFQATLPINDEIVIKIDGTSGNLIYHYTGEVEKTLHQVIPNEEKGECELSVFNEIKNRISNKLNMPPSIIISVS